MKYQARRRFLWMPFFARLAMILLFASISRGTTLARLSFEELAQKATAIARVRCLSVASVWESNEIWTESRFEVIDQNKGTLSKLFAIRLLGGTLGNLHSHVDGVPKFQPGEEVYVFLWAREGEPYRVLGWSQGTFRISRDKRTGFETTTQEAAVTAFYEPQSRQFVRGGMRGIPVADFRQRLNHALAVKTP